MAPVKGTIYIDVTDLADAHVKALAHARPSKVGIYNVGTGKGSLVKQFVEACKKATGVPIKIEYLSRRAGDYAEVYSDPSKIRQLDCEIHKFGRQLKDCMEMAEVAYGI